MEEFSCEISLPNIRLINDAVFIIWESNIQCAVDESDSGNKSNDENQLEEEKTDSETESYDEEEQTGQLSPYVTHTVVFKCIGSVRDAKYQDTLRIARDLIARGETVPGRVIPEPTNARALAFVTVHAKRDYKSAKFLFEISADFALFLFPFQPSYKI